MNPEMLKQAYKRDPQFIAGNFTKRLKGFGYPVQTKWVNDEIQRLIDGGKPRGGPSMFINGWLTEEIN